jgi:hypothetical protein
MTNLILQTIEHYWVIPILVVCISMVLFTIEVIRNNKLTMKYKGHYIGRYRKRR